MKPLGHWAMVFEAHETDRPGCVVHDEDPRRCSYTNGCDRCQGTGFLPCESPALAYVGSRPICTLCRARHNGHYPASRIIPLQALGRPALASDASTKRHNSARLSMSRYSWVARIRSLGLLAR